MAQLPLLIGLHRPPPRWRLRQQELTIMFAVLTFATKVPEAGRVSVACSIGIGHVTWTKAPCAPEEATVSNYFLGGTAMA